MNNNTNTDNPNCPQCRSSKVQTRGVLQGFKCDFCNNTWAEISIEDIEEAIDENTKVKIPEKPSQPLTISKVDGRTIELEGQRGASYRLTILEDANGKFRRKKAPSERNQFGSRWHNSEEVTYEIV